MNKLKTLSVGRIRLQAEAIRLGRDSKASKDSLNSLSKGKLVHHRSETYSMSLRKCLVVKEGQEREASKFKLKDKM